MIIKLPVPALSVVVRELETALELARSGRITGLALSYIANGELYDCAKAQDFNSALTLLGQSNMLRLDIIDIVRRFREKNGG